MPSPVCGELDRAEAPKPPAAAILHGPTILPTDRSLLPVSRALTERR